MGIELEEDEPLLRTLEGIGMASVVRGEIFEADRALDEKTDLAFRILELTTAIERAMGLMEGGLPLLLDCPHPNRNHWLDLEAETLRPSHDAVKLIAERMTEASSGAQDPKVAAIHSVWLSIEVLSRSRGDLAMAKELLGDTGPGPTPAQLIARGEVPIARHEVARRHRAIKLRREHPSLTNAVPISQEDLELLHGHSMPPGEGKPVTAGLAPETWESDTFTRDQFDELSAKIRDESGIAD